MFSILENRGALIDCQSTKDLFLYASSCHLDGVDDIVRIIGDAVFRPRYTDDEVHILIIFILAFKIEMGRQIITFENESMRRNPECEPLLTDWIHKVTIILNTL